MKAPLALLAILAAGSSKPAAAQVVPSTGTGTGSVSGYAIVLASSLNVRERPSLEAAVTAVVPRGQQLCILRTNEDWAEVAAPQPSETAPGTRARGWVSRGFISQRTASTEDLRRMGCSVSSRSAPGPQR